ncbi:MAG: hypothetical protein ACI9K2_006702 [Myxococcota bacterium]|jgi:hypothetical protein
MLCLWMLLGCGEPAPMFTCADRSELHDVTPLSGGRAVWCERKNGTRHGPFREFRADGSRFKDGQYHNNRKTGTWALYHPSGEPMESAEYAEGTLNGWKTVWSADGSVQSRTWNVDGEPSEPPEAP